MSSRELAEFWVGPASPPRSFLSDCEEASQVKRNRFGGSHFASHSEAHARRYHRESEIRFEYAQVEMVHLNGRVYAAWGAARRLFLNRVTPLLPLNPKARWWHVPVTGSRGERGHVRNKPRRESQSHLSRCTSTSQFHASHRMRCVVAGDCLDMRDSAAVVISRRGDRRRRVALAAS